MTTKNNKNEGKEKLAALTGVAIGIGPKKDKNDTSRQWWLLDENQQVSTGGWLSKNREGEITVSLPQRPHSGNAFDLSNRSVSVTVCGAESWDWAVSHVIPQVSVTANAYPTIAFELPDGVESFPHSEED